MAIALDTQSFVALNGIVLPASQFSGMEDPGLAPVFLVGNAGFEGVNFVRGLCMPALSFSAVPQRYWFNRDNLRLMFTNRANDTGILPSLGSCTYQIGAGESVQGDQMDGNFDTVFVPTMTIAGGARGTPLSASMGILPCGTPSAMPGSVDTTAMTLGSKGQFLSDGVWFGGQLTDVLSWSLVLTNSLVPDSACPSASGPAQAPDADSRIFPVRYINGSIGAGLTLLQRVGTASIIDAPGLSTINTVTITINSVETTATAGARKTIVLTFHGLKPTTSSAVAFGTTMKSRTYIGQSPAIGTSKISID